jgi:hypothetical protein
VAAFGNGLRRSRGYCHSIGSTEGGVETGAQSDHDLMEAKRSSILVVEQPGE